MFLGEVFADGADALLGLFQDRLALLVVLRLRFLQRLLQCIAFGAERILRLLQCVALGAELIADLCQLLLRLLIL